MYDSKAVPETTLESSITRKSNMKLRKVIDLISPRLTLVDLCRAEPPVETMNTT